MRAFNNQGFENDELVGIDWRSPDVEAIENEEGDVDAIAINGMPQDGLRTILRFILKSNAVGARRWRSAEMRLIALAHLCGVPGVGNISQSQIAKELNVTRALISHYFTSMADELDQAQARGGRSSQTRAQNATAASAAHARRQAAAV